MRYRMAWTALLVVACATWAEVATAQTVDKVVALMRAALDRGS